MHIMYAWSSDAMWKSSKHDEELLGFFDVCVEEGENNPLLLCEAIYALWDHV